MNAAMITKELKDRMTTMHIIAVVVGIVHLQICLSFHPPYEAALSGIPEWRKTSSLSFTKSLRSRRTWRKQHPFVPLDSSVTGLTILESSPIGDSESDNRLDSGNKTSLLEEDVSIASMVAESRETDATTNQDSTSEENRLAKASEKWIRFLSEEAPPVSILLLNLVAIIWGSQHAIIKTVVEDSDPAAFTFLRFGLASLIASPYLPGLKEIVGNTMPKEEESDDTSSQVDLWTPWRWGIEMGLWMFLGFSLQAIGLQSTTAQRSGFLLYLNVKFVPFFAYLLLGREISKWTWLSAVAAFSGTALLALDGESLDLNVGDAWSVLAAAASAMFILRLETASAKVPKASELNATSLAVVATLSGVWLYLGQTLQTTGHNLLSEITHTAVDHPLELVYLGAISTALANFIQAKAQKDVPAERASIIYSLDPVYGAFFSWLLLGETLGGPQGYLGAGIIFVAAATNSLLEFSKGNGGDDDEEMTITIEQQ